MIQGALVSLIFNRGLNTQSRPYGDKGVVTLMSTDVDAVSGSAEMLLETCAQAIEVAVGMVILGWQIGWLWPVPLVLIFCKSYIRNSSYFSSVLGW
jgi:ATP-binding cassette, subfamily C (CFTR/MRP), member 1